MKGKKPKKPKKVPFYSVYPGTFTKRDVMDHFTSSSHPKHPEATKEGENE